MRNFLLALVILGGVAHADGVYTVGEIGITGLRGPLLDGHSVMRLRGGFGIALDQWAVEGWYAGDVDLFTYDGCGTECAVGGTIAFAPASVGLETFGLDLRRDLPLIYGHPPRSLQFFRPRLSAFVHGGIREVKGDDGLSGMSGRGLGGGVGFEVNVRVFAAYVDFGLDRFELTSPEQGTIEGSEYHIVLGERIGFSL